MIELPLKPIPATDKSPRILLMYSAPKIGKTTLAALLENNLIIDFEDGARHIDAVRMKCIGLSAKYDYPLFKNNILIGNSETEKHKQDRLKRKEYYYDEIGQAIIESNRPYDYVTLDTVSVMEEMAVQAATVEYMATLIGKNFNRYGVEDINNGSKVGIGQIKPRKEWKSVLDLPNGAGYLHIRNVMDEQIMKSKKLADKVILVAHLKDKFIKDKTSGGDISANDIRLTGQLGNIICSKADAIGFLHRKDKQIFMNFKADETSVCGARPVHLRGQDILIGQSNDKGEIYETYWDKIYI